MARPLKPLVHSGGWYPSKKWIPLVRNGGYTTQNGGEQPEPEAVLKTVTGSLIHITDALALPAEALTVNVEPIQAGSGDPSPDNVRPISGRTSATVTRTGVNLFDPNTAGREHTTSSGIITGSDNRSVRVRAQEGITFTFSGTRISSGGSIAIAALNASGEVLTRQGTSTKAGVTITTPAGTVEILASVNKSTAFTDLQLEYGVSTATAYEPYAGNTYTIQLGDTVYGGTLDVTGGKMVVEWTSVTFDGSENWRSGSSNRFYVDVTNALYVRSSSAYIKSNRLPSIPAGSSGGNKNSCFVSGENSIGASVVDITTLVDFQSWLSSNPLQVTYKLVTPTEITLTPTQIEMLLGENNLWADAGDSTLTYYAEGEASTSEALGILLGGTYNNPGGADDVSDDEALGILLGGS